MNDFRIRRSNRKGFSSRESIPIEPVVAYYGGETKEGKNVSVRCFLHEDTRKSAVIDTVKQVYFCHTCAQGGDAIALIKIKEGVDFKDAKLIAVRIIEKSGVGILRGSGSKNNRVPRRTWDL